MHIERTGRFNLPLAPDQAFPLFSPDGERSWVAGWEPVPFHAPDGDLARAGAVFTTAVGGETTLWLVLEFDRSGRTARYARITPGSRIGTVRVSCHEGAQRGTEVEVTYELTSLSAAGEEVLAALTPAAYAEMLAEWERKVLEIL